MKHFFTALFIFVISVSIFLPAQSQEQKKKALAVLDLVNAGGVDKNEMAILTNRLNNYLVTVDVYDVLERDKVASILKEQEFVMSDNCNSSECAVQIGKLLGMDLMLTGQVGKFGTVYVLDLRIIDVTTGKIMKTKSENYEGKKEGLLDMIEGLAYTISGKTAPVKTTKTTTGTGSTVTGNTTTDDSSDEIKIGTVTKKSGSLEINCEMDGTLYINDKQIGEVTEGSIIPIEKLKVGEHKIKIVYSDGEFLETIKIEYNQKAKLTASKSSGSTFKDPRDGKVYKTVKIGNQVWMAENLNYDAGSGSWCCDDNSSNCSQYGRLYNWETAKGVAPQGWHLPSKAEYETLLNNLEGSGTSAYTNIIPGGASGFKALFGGWRGSGGRFYGVGKNVSFWSSSEDEDSSSWGLYVYSGGQKANVVSNSKSNAFSVRLVKE
jgi:uncharacterized protein (TIGR02145 family)